MGSKTKLLHGRVGGGDGYELRKPPVDDEQEAHVTRELVDCRSVTQRFPGGRQKHRPVPVVVKQLVVEAQGGGIRRRPGKGQFVAEDHRFDQSVETGVFDSELQVVTQIFDTRVGLVDSIRERVVHGTRGREGHFNGLEIIGPEFKAENDVAGEGEGSRYVHCFEHAVGL